MKVFYWSPFISEVATTYAVINSIKSIHKFSKNNIVQCKVIDVFNEWDPYQKILDQNKIEIVKLKTFLNIKKLPTSGFLKSRLTYILVFFFSIIKLHKKIKIEKPDFLIIHLISYIPLFLLNLFNYKTKFILRISGFPKMNFLRKIFWKISDKNLYKIFCPTEKTKIKLIDENVFSKEKMHVVNDPVIDVYKISKKIKRDFDNSYNWLKNKKFVLSIGRLSKQKNFIFLIKNFKKILEKNPDLNLVILGEGEDRGVLEKLIFDENLKNNVFLLGYQDNIYPFIKASLFFVLTSDWEDPGFVILEAMFSRKIILSSNCESGPKEIISNGSNGFLYKKRDSNDFCKNFFLVLEFIKNKNEVKKIKIKSLLTCKKYTQFNHFKIIKNYLI